MLVVEGLILLNILIINSPAVKKAVEDACKKMGHGMSIEALVNDDRGALRPLFNLFQLNEWKKSFVYRGNDDVKEDLW